MTNTVNKSGQSLEAITHTKVLTVYIYQEFRPDAAFGFWIAFLNI